jgi:hypothetical protein
LLKIFETEKLATLAQDLMDENSLRYRNALKMIEWQTLLGIDVSRRRAIEGLVSMSEADFWRQFHKTLSSILPLANQLHEEKEAKRKEQVANEKAKQTQQELDMLTKMLQEKFPVRKTSDHVEFLAQEDFQDSDGYSDESSVEDQAEL